MNTKNGTQEKYVVRAKVQTHRHAIQRRERFLLAWIIWGGIHKEITGAQMFLKLIQFHLSNLAPVPLVSYQEITAQSNVVKLSPSVFLKFYNSRSYLDL